MKKLLMTALVAVTILSVSDCYSQSFKDKLKAKAAAANSKNTGSTTNSSSKGGTTYYLMEAERGKTKVQLEEGDNNGTKIIDTRTGDVYYYRNGERVINRLDKKLF